MKLHQKPSAGSRIRVLLASSISIVLLLVVFILTISNHWALPSSVLELLTLLLGVLALIITLWQWLIPFSTLPSQSSGSMGQQEARFCRQVGHQINRRLEKGVLIVFLPEDTVGRYVYLQPQHFDALADPGRKHRQATRSEIGRRYQCGRGYVCAAVFRDLDPEDYLVWVNDETHPRPIPVFRRKIARISW